MATLKISILVCTCVAVLAIMFLVVRLICRPLTQNGFIGDQMKMSFVVWYTLMFVSAAIVFYKAVSLNIEAIDIILKTNRSNWLIEVLKMVSIFTGFSAIWLVIWRSVSSLFIRIFVLNRHESNEMDNDNYGYFLFKGAVLIVTIWSLNSLFETIMRIFMPTITDVFYH